MNEEKIFYKDDVITINIISNGKETYYKLQDNLLKHDPVRDATLSGVLSKSSISRNKMQEVINYIFLKWTLILKLWIGTVNTKISFLRELRDKRKLQKEINVELYKVIVDLGGKGELLKIIGNYCNTISDKETLNSLKHYNKSNHLIQL
jgi:hypothetical protein